MRGGNDIEQARNMVPEMGEAMGEVWHSRHAEIDGKRPEISGRRFRK